MMATSADTTPMTVPTISGVLKEGLLESVGVEAEEVEGSGLSEVLEEGMGFVPGVESVDAGGVVVPA
jgi:hypothetical protein